MYAFTLDEYIGLPPDDPRSVSYRIRHQLLHHVNVRSDHIHMPDGLAADLQAACAEYDRLLDEHSVDLGIVGVGSNGHIGFNEPVTPLVPASVLQLHPFLTVILDKKAAKLL